MNKKTGTITNELELKHQGIPAYMVTDAGTENFTATTSSLFIKEDNNQMTHIASKYPKPPTKGDNNPD